MSKEASGFLPEDYEGLTMESGGGGENYMRFRPGENRFRVVGSAITGWEGWDKTGEKPFPVRSKRKTPDLMALNTADDKVKEFWAFPVLDRGDARIKVLEVTQKTVMQGMMAFVDDPDWGNPQAYDIIVSRRGQGIDTEYSVIAKPKAELELPQGQREFIAKIELPALYDGGDPFEHCDHSANTGQLEAVEASPEEEDDIPF